MSARNATDGRVPPGSTIARVTLRPIGSPLPLGAFALVPAGLLVAGLQLHWFAVADAKTVGYLLLGFAVPVQLVATVFAFLGRDSLVGTGFGLFTGTWLAFALTQLTRGMTYLTHHGKIAQAPSTGVTLRCSTTQGAPLNPPRECASIR